MIFFVDLLGWGGRLGNMKNPIVFTDKHSRRFMIDVDDILRVMAHSDYVEIEYRHHDEDYTQALYTDEPFDSVISKIMICLNKD